jgi:D-glycero-D-manno-heptose 1,7-bisphosphate phosphatase
MIKNLILDCDGTVLELVPGTLRGPRSIKEVNVCDEVSEFFRLNVDRFQAFLITNQPDISRGNADPDELEYIYRKLMGNFPMIRDYRVCPHDNLHTCHCRKPKPGMIEDLMQCYKFNKDETLVIGDSWVDILAAQNIGIRSVLIRKSHSWSSNSQGSPPFDLHPEFEILSFTQLNESFFSNFYP